MGPPWGPPWAPGPKIMISIGFFGQKGPGGIPQAPEEPGEKIQQSIATIRCTRCRFSPISMFFRHSPTAVFGLKTSRRLSAHPGPPWDPPLGPERPLWPPERPLWSPERPLWAPEASLGPTEASLGPTEASLGFAQRQGVRWAAGAGRREPGAGRRRFAESLDPLPPTPTPTHTRPKSLSRAAGGQA